MVLSMIISYPTSSLYFLISNYRTTRNMFQSFLTAIDGNQLPKRPRRDEGMNGTPAEGKLREGIRNLVCMMMPHRELCARAATNMGLPLSLLDFERVLKVSATEGNVASLTFTFGQLTNLQKQCVKLKRIIPFHNSKIEPFRNDTRATIKKQTILDVGQQEWKKQNESNQILKRAMQQQLAFRIKVKNMNSRQKLEKKQQILKKKAEKAKSMNKRALKVYKNYKIKEEQSYDFFKMSSHHSETNLNSPEKPQKNKQLKLITTSKQSLKDGQSQKSYEGLKVSIMLSQYIIQSQKSKTPKTRLRIRYNQSNLQQSAISKTTHQRFAEYKKREAATRTKKQQLQKSKEKEALFRLIKKNEKLIQLQQRNQKEQQKKAKKLQKLHQQSLKKSHPCEIVEDFDNVIKDKCQAGLMRRQLHLQQQVNRARQTLKTKEQRRERHRMLRQRQQEMSMTLNEQYLKSYMNRLKQVKMGDLKHEMTIKRRHQQLREKENDEKMMNNLAKYTDQELIKSIERLNNAEGKNSFINY